MIIVSIMIVLLTDVNNDNNDSNNIDNIITIDNHKSIISSVSISNSICWLPAGLGAGHRGGHRGLDGAPATTTNY